LRKAVLIATDISLGLWHLHTKSFILHNDITSKNILYAPHSKEKRGFYEDKQYCGKKDFSVKIADLGLSSFIPRVEDLKKETPFVPKLDLEDLKDDVKNSGGTKHDYFSGFTGFNSPIGNARWRSPEGTKTNQSTEKSDCWSFGIVFWELLTNKVPFEEIRDPKEVACKVAFDGLQLKIPENLPPILHSLLQDCLNYDPIKRPSMFQVSAILKRYLSDTSPNNCCYFSDSSPNKN